MSAMVREPERGRFGVATPGVPRTLVRKSREPDLQPPLVRRSWRQRALRVVGVVLAAGLLAVGGWLLGRSTVSHPRAVRVLATTAAVSAGARLSAADVRYYVVQVPAKGSLGPYLGPAQLGSVLGLAVRSTLAAGSILNRSELTGHAAMPASNQALVGLALKSGQLPSDGLAVGDDVGIIIVPPDTAGASPRPVPVARAPVWDVGTTTSDVTPVTVLVPSSLASALAGEASRGDVALIRMAGPAPTGSPPTPSR